MVNNVIEVVNYVIAARPSLLNFVIADSHLIRNSRHIQPAARRIRLAGDCRIRNVPGLA